MIGLESPIALGSLVLGPFQFDRPVWLLLIPVLGVLSWLIGRKSLSGLGQATKWTALVVRLIVIALLAGALGEPHRRDVSDDVAVIAVIDASRSVPAAQQELVGRYIADASESSRRAGDKLGTVTAARQAYVQARPSRHTREVDRQFIGATDGTNLGEAVRLGLATAATNAANRIVLISDGNETAGSLLRAGEAARAVGVPIDVLAVEYSYDSEVIVDQLISPATVRAGETINLRVAITATAATTGRLSITESGHVIDLDPSGPAAGVLIELAAGKNVFPVPVTPVRPGPQDFEAVFEPVGSLSSGGGSGDAIVENNRARSITFVGSEGFVLVVAETPEESAALVRVLDESEMRPVLIDSGKFPSTLAEINGYEAVVLLNEPSYNFTDHQQEILRQYVHDSGGGLVMVGGPEAFGAGGWIGSPLADALPIRLDPPQKRQMPRGALALVIHSVEIPRGVYYGKEVCRAAVDNLSRLDLVGIVEYGMGGTDWVHPLSPVGDRGAVYKSINGLTFGDMPSFDPSLNLALQGLKAASAGQRHCIVISDGDPSLSKSIVSKFKRAGITISAVGVNPHSPGDVRTLRYMATATGGEFYNVASNALATLPEIFIKEAQTIRRSLIWEGEAFSPAVVSVAAEPMRGIRGVPPITGYVVAAEREGLSLVTLRGKENDPIGAIWQHGLGKVVTFTSDATSRWAGSWVGWEAYKQFWEQHVRWAMRPGGSATMRITTENQGDNTLVVIEAFDPEGERLNFANFQSRVAKPGGDGAAVEIRQVGPGRYEGFVDSSDAGAYVLGLKYRALDGDGNLLEGSAQAAITRPYADEFRSLTSNRGLLGQVAAMTGGRELTGDPRADDLWSRIGLTKPVALTSIWLAVALFAIGLFLVDVGVRRVRVNPAMIAGAVRRGFGKTQKKDISRLASLREAREKAHERLTSEQVKERKKTAGRKFEVSEGAIKVDQSKIMGRSDAPLDKPVVKAPKAGRDEKPEDSLSALRRAKRRAQEEFDD